MSPAHNERTPRCREALSFLFIGYHSVIRDLFLINRNPAVAFRAGYFDFVAGCILDFPFVHISFNAADFFHSETVVTQDAKDAIISRQSRMAVSFYRISLPLIDYVFYVYEYYTSSGCII